MKIQAAIQGFLMDWELRGRSQATLRIYRSCLGVVARWLEGQGITQAEDVTISHLRAFILDTQQRPAGSVNPNRPTQEGVRRLNGNAAILCQGDQAALQVARR